MIRLAQSPVVFTEKPHGYHLGDKRLSGITSLIHEVLRLGVYPDASDYVNSYCVPHAGAYGTAVHHAIRHYDELGIYSAWEDVVWYIRKPLIENGIRVKINGTEIWVSDMTLPHQETFDVKGALDNYIRNKQGFTAIANEYTISDNCLYASQIDNVWQKDDTGGIWLVDTKTNNLELYPGGEEALKEYLSWQLSIYAYLFEQQNPELKVEGLAANWLRKTDARFWIIPRKPDDEVRKLLSVHWVEAKGRFLFNLAEAECLGQLNNIATAAIATQSVSLILPQDVIDTIYDFLLHEKDAKKQGEELKAKLRDAMEANGIKSWDSGKFKATIAADSTTTTFDTRRFKADHPELYKEYTKQTAKKGSFTITLREE